jgi:Repeat of unknown function (DUF5648)
VQPLVPRSAVVVALAMTLGACTIIGDLGKDGVSADGSAGGSEGATGEDGTTGEVDTALPTLPELTNLTLRVVGDAAKLTFDPVDDALDYRIYPLPADADIHVGEDGSIVIDDALYRCAGRREALYMVEDILGPEEGWNDNAAAGTSVIARQVVGFGRTEADATLGHVYLTEADDRVPVYALGDPDPTHDGAAECGRAAFATSRTHRYTTDANLRATLVAAHWRDDGIAFWIPREPGPATRPVYEGTFVDDTLLHWIDGPEAEARGPGTAIFDVLREAGLDTTPLRRVHVMPYCGRAHDELVAGLARDRQVRRQGDQPLAALRWSGITGPVTLVAEAIDQGCPYQGSLSPVAEPAFDDEGVAHEAYVTLAQMRAASATGEVFVNGQTDDPPPARPIARSFVRVVPDVPAMEFYATFPTAGDFAADFGAPTGNVYNQQFASPEFTLSSYGNSHIHFGSFLGELWLVYNDVAAGVNGMVRLSAQQTARIEADTFLHVTTEFDLVTTDRRFPQLFLSDQPAPLQDNLASGTTWIIGPVGYAPSYLQLQLCDHVTWDLGAECPRLPTFAPSFAPQVRPPGDTAGSDSALQLDVYVSTSRIYLLVDGAPYSCTDLPTAADDGVVHAPPVGEVTVSWGDVLAHSAIDFTTGGGAITAPDSYGFHRRHMQSTTRRHLDNLGFESGVASPAWDETRVPCSGG